MLIMWQLSVAEAINRLFYCELCESLLTVSALSFLSRGAKHFCETSCFALSVANFNYRFSGKATQAVPARERRRWRQEQALGARAKQRVYLVSCACDSYVFVPATHGTEGYNNFVPSNNLHNRLYEHLDLKDYGGDYQNWIKYLSYLNLVANG